MSHKSSSARLASRSAGLALRLLAVAFLLLAQLSFAGHHHDDVSERSVDDCSVCLQLHSVKHAAGPNGSSHSFFHLLGYQTASPELAAASVFHSLLPPCRAPPHF